MDLNTEKTKAVIIQVLFCRYFASKIIPKQSLSASWNLSDPQENIAMKNKTVTISLVHFAASSGQEMNRL